MEESGEEPPTKKQRIEGDDIMVLLKNIQDGVKTMVWKIEDIERKLHFSLNMSVVANFKASNPWECDNFSKKSGSQIEGRINVLRQNFLIHNKLATKDESGNYQESQSVKCMLTGLNGKLRLARLLPLNTKPSIVKSLSMDGKLNDFRNCLLLSENVQYAYDHQKISFIPVPNMLTNEYVMKVWDSEVLEETVFSKSEGPKLSEFVGKPLIFNIGGIEHRAFKRCLSYHNFMCFMKWSLHSQSILSDEDDFSSTLNGNWLKQRDLYLESLNTRIQRDLQENSGDDFEDNDDYDNSDIDAL